VGAVERPAWASPDLDLDRPSPARIYDYHLGGSHNFAADRRAAEEIVAVMPDLPDLMRANRRFLRRAVRFCAQAGVDQFLDLGSGIPTVGNVHEIAQEANPRARVVYVDVDPVAVTISRTLLADNPNAGVVQADMRRPDQVLAAPGLRRLLDLDRPVAVLAVAVMHFVPDRDDPAGILAAYRDATCPGSYLALSHGEAEPRVVGVDEAADMYSRDVAPVTLRTRPQVAALFAGYDLVPPGLVSVTEWRPEPGDEYTGRIFPQIVAVGRRT
jgi:S-adenosyl methyltransferase